ncbi:hypothetical protein [Cellulomonas marina]|uniref:Uncharacterized protein n=1 Tax=Cellulomonas marina TaxID=988821 RepID=A0A1I1APJ0_9CELL|nr:hypothetical protein [Cellulomonas marina]GIG29315.1 hypothetical protein Cma02nite_19150 [Cellulomonas marina]SFB39877.1 hypothetical protein SAMN05421867_1218 [Cellulomonas marina]
MDLLERIEGIVEEARAGADGPMPHSSVRPDDFYVEAFEQIAGVARAERERQTRAQGDSR